MTGLAHKNTSNMAPVNQRGPSLYVVSGDSPDTVQGWGLPKLPNPKKVAKKARKGLKKSAKAARNRAKKLRGKIKKLAKASRKKLKKAGKNARKAVKKTAKSARRNLKKTGKGFRKTIKRTAKSARKNLKKADKSARKTVKKAAKSASKNLKKTDKGIRANAKKAVSSASKNLGKLTKNKALLAAMAENGMFDLLNQKKGGGLFDQLQSGIQHNTQQLSSIGQQGFDAWKQVHVDAPMQVATGLTGGLLPGIGGLLPGMGGAKSGQNSSGLPSLDGLMGGGAPPGPRPMSATGPVSSMDQLYGGAYGVSGQQQAVGMGSMLGNPIVLIGGGLILFMMMQSMNRKQVRG